MNHGPLIEELSGPSIHVIPPTPLRPIDFSNLGQLQRAQEILADPRSPAEILLKFNKDILRTLCEERHISYPGKSQKLDLVKKLFAAVSHIVWKRFGRSDWPLSLVGLPVVLTVTNMRGARWKWRLALLFWERISSPLSERTWRKPYCRHGSSQHHGTGGQPSTEN